MECKGCMVLCINGTRAHELGCPYAWLDEARECDWCGAKFVPETGVQRFCSDECMEEYFN